MSINIYNNHILTTFNITFNQCNSNKYKSNNIIYTIIFSFFILSHKIHALNIFLFFVVKMPSPLMKAT